MRSIKFRARDDNEFEFKKSSSWAKHFAIKWEQTEIDAELMSSVREEHADVRVYLGWLITHKLNESTQITIKATHFTKYNC